MASAIVERRTTLNLIQFTRKVLSMENGTNQNTDMAKKMERGVYPAKRSPFLFRITTCYFKEYEIEFS